MTNIINNLRRKVGDEGSGLVTVLLVVALVTTLGSLMLYMGFINVSMKGSDRETRENFYGAEVALDTTRAELQNVASRALDGAYTYQKTHLAESFDNAKFAYKFLEFFADEMKTETATTGSNLHNLYIKGTYNGSGALNTTLPVATGSDTVWDVFINSAGAYDATLTAYGEITAILLTRDLPWSYAEGGYYNEIYTDIKINIGKTASAPTEGMKLENYVIVAEDKLVFQANSTIIGDKIWTANIDAVDAVSAGGSSSTTINAKKLYVYGVQDSVAGGYKDGNILIGPGDTLNITNTSGDVFVRGDLRLNGTQANPSRVALSGNYYGVGGDTVNGNKSSAILVNGRGSTLNLGGLSSLSLSGRAFVEPANDPSYFYPLSTSISVQSDQFAFLVPSHLLSFDGGTSFDTKPNPYVGSETSPLLKTQEDDTTGGIGGWLWTEYPEDYDGDAAKYAVVSNRNSLDKYHVTTYKRQFVAGTNTVYFYIEFTNAGYREQFFKDYLTMRGSSDDMGVTNDYLFDSYLASYTITSGTKKTAGQYYDRNNDGSSVDKGGFPVGGGMIDSPYESFVTSRTDISGIGGTFTFQDDTGKKIIISNGDIPSIDGATRLVITTGNVNVIGGTPICTVVSAGTVTMSGGTTITAATTDDIKAIIEYLRDNTDWKDTTGTKDIRDYLKITSFGVHSVDEDEWGNLNDLVTFVNWSKNENLYRPTPTP
ncbi:MAG: hypothetical protein LBN43_05640 [Oscillospiraceae bacterium]|nr:hypothetical protein [Oscillospiraceae bacterium]